VPKTDKRIVVVLDTELKSGWKKKKKTFTRRGFSSVCANKRKRPNHNTQETKRKN